MNKLTLVESGDEFRFEYESKDEVYLELNGAHLAVLFRDDAIELIGFLSQFVDQALNEE